MGIEKRMISHLMEQAMIQVFHATDRTIWDQVSGAIAPLDEVTLTISDIDPYLEGL